jgi:hypothetical protein
MNEGVLQVKLLNSRMGLTIEVEVEEFEIKEGISSDTLEFVTRHVRQPKRRYSERFVSKLPRLCLPLSLPN